MMFLRMYSNNLFIQGFINQSHALPLMLFASDGVEIHLMVYTHLKWIGR